MQIPGNFISKKMYFKTYILPVFFSRLTSLILIKTVDQLKEHIILTCQFSLKSALVYCPIVNTIIVYRLLTLLVPLYYNLPREWTKGG